MNKKIFIILKVILLLLFEIVVIMCDEGSFTIFSLEIFILITFMLYRERNNIGGYNFVYNVTLLLFMFFALAIILVFLASIIISLFNINSVDFPGLLIFISYLAIPTSLILSISQDFKNMKTEYNYLHKTLDYISCLLLLFSLIVKLDFFASVDTNNYFGYEGYYEYITSSMISMLFFINYFYKKISMK